jgi:phage terminase large subunit-like protein
LSDPTKTLLELVTSGKIRHGGHPILRWHASNAVAVSDPAGNLKLDKSKRPRKIDGIAAMVNAVAAAIAYSDGAQGASIYETRGPIFITGQNNFASTPFRGRF